MVVTSIRKKEEMALDETLKSIHVYLSRVELNKPVQLDCQKTKRSDEKE